MAHTASPLRYPGGKSSLTTFLSSVITANNLNECTYIEPFCGGAGAALQLIFANVVEHIHINDADPLIYAFWWSVLNHTDAFLERMYSTEVNVECWQHQKNILKDTAGISLFDKGFAVFFLNRCNHSGILSANPIGGIKQNGKWKLSARFNKQTLDKKIRKIQAYRDKITVTNMDIFEMFEANLLQQEDTFVFFDPPYLKHGPKLYMNFFSIQQHTKLASILRNSNLSNWVMTYDDADEIKKLYSWCSVSEFTLTHHANKAKKGKELLIKPKHIKSIHTPTPMYHIFS